MGLAGQAALGSHGGDAQVGPSSQQLSRPGQSSAKQVLVGRLPRGLPEGRDEMKARQPGHLRHLRQRDGLGQMGLHEFGDIAQGPLGKPPGRAPQGSMGEGTDQLEGQGQGGRRRRPDQPFARNARLARPCPAEAANGLSRRPRDPSVAIRQVQAGRPTRPPPPRWSPNPKPRCCSGCDPYRGAGTPVRRHASAAASGGPTPPRQRRHRRPCARAAHAGCSPGASHLHGPLPATRQVPCRSFLSNGPGPQFLGSRTTQVPLL